MNQGSQSVDDLVWNQEQHIAPPLPGAERRMPIRYMDWERVKGRVSHMGHPLPRLPIAYSVFFGISATAGLSLIPLASAGDLPTWVMIVYGSVTFGALGIAAVCVYLDRRLRSEARSDAAECLSDMEGIESTFPSA